MGLRGAIAGTAAVWCAAGRYVRIAGWQLSTHVGRRCKIVSRWCPGGGLPFGFGDWCIDMGNQPRANSQTEAAEITDKLKNVTVDDLAKTVAKFPAELSEGDKTLALCGAFIGHLFGPGWLERHVLPTAPSSAYLRLDENVSLKEKHARIMRLAEFAETLFNLRDVAGIEACIKELLDNKIESACAELDAARLLRTFDVPFVFVLPQKLARGEDYDFLIQYPDGLEVAAEAKCKFEATNIRPISILNTLHDKREQLPKGKPGIFLVKVPPAWIESVTMANAVVATAHKFFSRGTRRVVSVKFYAQPIVYVGDLTIGTQIFSEVSNPNAIIAGRDWNLFRGTKRLAVNPERSGKPEWWIQFIYFPTGRPRA